MDELPMAISSRPWSRHECISFAAFAVALGIGLIFLTHPWYDPAPDVFTYIATARSLAAGDGYQYLGAPFGIRPPGFSLLIAPWVGDGVDFAALNLLVGLFGVASVLALAALLRDRIGLRLALLVAGCLWLNPGFQILSNQVLSDVPGTALIFGCLLLERIARRRGGVASFALLGVAIGAAAYVRSMALLVVPATVLALLWRAWPERRLRPALIASLALAGSALLVLAPWSIRNGSLPDAPADFTRIHSYSVAMWHELPHDPGSRRLSPVELAARIPLRLEQTVSTLGSRLQVKEKGNTLQRGSVSVGHAVLGVGLLAGLLVQLLRRRETTEIFAVLCLGVVLVYFGFSWRLLLPVYALALGATLETLRDLTRHRTRDPVPVIVCAVAVVALLLLDLPPRRGWDALENEHARLEAFADSVEAQLDESQVLASTQVAFGALLDRPVYNLRPALRRGASPQELESLIDRHGIQVLATDPEDPLARSFEAHLRTRYGQPFAAASVRLWTVRPAASTSP